MERKGNNNLLNAVVLLVATVCVFAVGRYANSLSAQVAAVFVGYGFVVALVSWFQMRLEERERLERMEYEELTKARSTSALFNEGTDAFNAGRSREQFERYFVPGITIALMLAQGVGAWLLWQWLHKPDKEPLNQPAVALSIFGVLFLLLFLLGRYSAGLARIRNDRLLRPGANHVLLSAYLCGVVMLTIVAAWAKFPRTDYFLSVAGAALLGLIAFETLMGLVLELYRPRVKGKQTRLLYESRLVGLLSHPEGLFSTAAHVLDYQFGFKVSETSFYRFAEKNFPRLLIAQLALLLLSSCFVFIEAGEAGLLERFGRPVEKRDVLKPGMHLKWFWPVDRVQRFRTDEIQTFNVGFVHQEEKGHRERPEEETVLWTVRHYQEEFNLLVASRETGVTTNTVEGKRIPPVSLLSVSIPVQFQISDVRKWAYKHMEPAKLLEDIGTREVVRYLVGVDLLEIMSTGRFKAAEELHKRIQERADEEDLGVKIVFLGLQDIHPPVSVAGSYEEVIGATQKRQAERLKAQADAVGTNSWAQAESLQRRRGAEAASISRALEAAAQAARFTNQIPAYQASPGVYQQLAYAQALSQGSAATRKLVMTGTNSQDVILLNLEDRLRPEIF
jgi:regulator of protease activity HflC (stomatin/prohibitin superfamily)